MGEERWRKRRLCLLFLACLQSVLSIEIVPAPILRPERSDDLQRLGPIQTSQLVQPVVFQNGTLSTQDIERAIEEARSAVLGRFSAQLRVDNTRLPIVVARNVTVSGLIAEEATRLLAVRHRLTKDDISRQFATFSTGNTADDDCPVEDHIACRPQKYRSHDSFCNNVQNPRWGNAIAPYGRLLPADYSDGISSLRLSVSGQQLPPASLVSERVHGTSRIASGFLTSLAAVWGQFIQNDISSPITFSDIFGPTSCCAGGVQSACLQMVSADGKTCKDYQRLASSSRRKCALGPREALNGMTAFLDGSSIYGTIDGEESELRLFEQGLMKTSPGDLVPLMSEGTVCNPRSPNSTCYKTGDPRVNGHPALIALHTLFIREHNRLVQKLAEVNPLWDDDTLYEEARRINIAAIQHITYKEFLPTVLGESLSESLKLKPKLSGYSTDYDIFAYPGTLEVTAGAILDFVLSMIPEKFDTFGMKGEKKKSMSMVDMAGALTNEQVEEIMLGLVSSMANRVGLSVAPGVRQLHGRDIVAELLTRGRDLGISGYTSWRKYCGLRVPTSFEDMTDMMPQSNIQLLQSVYKDVSDIDLFTAGLAEIPLKGAVVGPTFGCLMAHQFTMLRRADRFWYENDVPPNSFSKHQLQEIRKVTLASLICKNFENIPAVPPRAFQEKDAFLNSPVSCNLMPDIDLTLWESDSPALQVPDDLMEISMQEAMKKLEKRRQDEELLFKNNLGADPKSSIGTAFGFSRPTMAAIYMSNTSLLLEYASLQFLENLENPEFTRVRRQLFNNVANFFNQLGQQLNTRRPNSGRALAQGLPNVDVGRFVNTPSPPQPCRGNEETLPCDHTAPFRTFSGHCNNLANPSFGKQLTTFSRLLPAGYDDGISRPRWRSVTGRPLPSPRLISITVHQDFSSPHRRYTMILMQFGQFLDHDITMTPVSRGVQNAILNCRDCDSTRNVHPECWPIPIPANDPFFPRVNAQGKAQCIPFTRSLAGQQRLGARDQVNQNTAYLDGSQIYGETFCNSRRLRSFVGGRLNSTISPFRGKELLPQTSRMAECKASSGLCFEAGDARSSEQPGLTIFHTIMMREHNRIAGTLQTMNPQWDDERIYQQARRINTAVWQHIIYNEFVPRILGWNAVNLYGLNLLTEGYFEGYDSTCNGQVFNEFATAAYRFGHSLVRPFFPRVNSAFQETARLPLRAGFFNPESLMENTMLDDFIRGMFVTPMENLDQFVTGEITNHLFESKNFPFSGLDLISLNIQRGRDHGLRPYNEYRAACNLKKAATFEDLSREIAPELIQRLQQVYASVDDIDLFTGGLSETPLQGGLVGPTFACVIGNQFRTLRRCDRFWYENGNTAGRFTEAQLAEIRKVNFARVVCENSDTISEITRSPFDIPHNFLNPRVQCRTLPTMDLNPWRDSDRSCVAQGKVIALGASSLVSPCTSCTCTSEGAQCQSLRVDCQRLLTEVGRDAILADSVCRVQCSFLVPEAAAQPVTPAFQRPANPPQRQRGARFRNIFRFG